MNCVPDYSQKPLTAKCLSRTEAAEEALTRLLWVTAAIAGPERIAIR